ncbi:hypothetical protein UB48_26730, partial [Pseudomonas sp. 2(2015)]
MTLGVAVSVTVLVSMVSVVDVVFRRWNSDAALGLTCRDGDDFTIAQGDFHFGASRVGQRGGVDDVAAFGDGAGGSEFQTGSVIGAWTISNGGHRITCGIQLLVVATGGAGD